MPYANSNVFWRRGDIGWILLAAFVWLWDAYAPETLSRAFWRGLEHPRSRPFVLVAWGWVTSHLFFRKPARILIKW